MDEDLKTYLKDKVIVITGGAGDIASVWVNTLSEYGAKIAILDRNLELAQKKADEVTLNKNIAIAVETNVLDKKELEKAHKVVLEKLGPCDILINAAGGNNPKGTTTKEYLYKEDLVNHNKDVITFFDLDEQGIKFVFDLNFIGTLLPTQEFAKDMIGKKSCSIVNISSMNAFTPLTKIPAYSGAKAAVSNFTRWLAVHLSKVGIRVNAIAPGFFVTKQNEVLLKNTDGSFNERAEKIIRATPMGRFGDTSELVGVLLFLINENASSFVNGVVIPVDGGFSAYSGV